MLRNGKREARDAPRWHHDELGTAKDEPFGLLRRSLGFLAVKMRIQGFLTITNGFYPVLHPETANREPMSQNQTKVT